MRIVYLLERADQLWGGVKVVLEDANHLAAKGHEVTVVARSGPPTWMPVHASFLQVSQLDDPAIPPSDVCIGTYWTTVPFAHRNRARAVVHFCQGFEGDAPENEPIREKILGVYGLPASHFLVISDHLEELLAPLGRPIHRIPQSIDPAIHHPPAPHQAAARRGPMRVGLVGHYGMSGKGIRDGIVAVGVAAVKSSHPGLELVRISSGGFDPIEQNLPFPVELHSGVLPGAMGDLYRTMDVLLGPVNAAEGFYLPAVEAMACGVPCVLTDLPCFRTHGSSPFALVVPRGDSAAMASALLALRDNADLRAIVRSAGLEVAARYTPSVRILALESALERVLAAVPGPSRRMFAGLAGSGFPAR